MEGFKAEELVHSVVFLIKAYRRLLSVIAVREGEHSTELGWQFNRTLQIELQIELGGLRRGCTHGRP